jgi:16S rRNA (guanine527-N7)-methyltransferase
MNSGSDLKAILVDGAREFGVNLESEQIERLFKYKEILKEWNEKMNLTAIEDDKDVIIKHFIDSLSIIPYIKNKNASLIDVGTGAGFPGIPLKISIDDLNITLLDSLDKRVKFLNEVVTLLNLKHIRAVHGRAEDYGIKAEHREKYDIAVARAVANLPVLLEYCLPFVKTGGIFIAMKGSNVDEIDTAKKALDVLGGQIAEVFETVLPDTDMKRSIIIIRKLRQTPTKYPRKAGKPSKEPIV